MFLRCKISLRVVLLGENFIYKKIIGLYVVVRFCRWVWIEVNLDFCLSGVNYLRFLLSGEGDFRFLEHLQWCMQILGSLKFGMRYIIIGDGAW